MISTRRFYTSTYWGDTIELASTGNDELWKVLALDNNPPSCWVDEQQHQKQFIENTLKVIQLQATPRHVMLLRSTLFKVLATLIIIIFLCADQINKFVKISSPESILLTSEQHQPLKTKTHFIRSQHHKHWLNQFHLQWKCLPINYETTTIKGSMKCFHETIHYVQLLTLQAFGSQDQEQFGKHLLHNLVQLIHVDVDERDHLLRQGTLLLLQVHCIPQSRTRC